jgi:hypothetical protein
VQLTLRDADEEHLLTRLTRLLERFPAEPKGPPSQGEPETPPAGFCIRHRVQMTRHRNAKGAWWSHQLDTGTWCHGK